MADFSTIKERVTIEDVAKMLGLQMKKEPTSLRCKCPVHGGDNRSLAITPSRGLFYCMSEKKGGDCIELVCHVEGIKPREAGEKIAAHFRLDSAPTTPPAPQKKEAAIRSNGMQPLQDLDPLHEAVEAIGITPATADAMGIGYRDRGTLGAGIYIPLRNEDGFLAGYMRIKLDDPVPFRFPKNLEEQATNVVPLRKKGA